MPRIRKSWLHAPRRKATRRWRSPTNARSPASCGRTSKRKNAQLKLIIGSEFRLDDGLRFVLLATDRESYGNLSALITRGRRSAREGQLSPDARRSCRRRRRLSRAVAARPDPDVGRSALAQPRFRGALWIAAERLLEADDAARCKPISPKSPSTIGLPLVAAGDVHMHVRDRRALQDTLTAIRLKTTVAQAGHALLSERRAPFAADRDARAHLSCRRGWPKRWRSPDAADSRWTSCATNIRRRSFPRAKRRRPICGG